MRPVKRNELTLVLQRIIGDTRRWAGAGGTSGIVPDALAGSFINIYS
ncbi:MAG TPA: hypothetical protein VF008_30810 [Niastella sp.]